MKRTFLIAAVLLMSVSAWASKKQIELPENPDLTLPVPISEIKFDDSAVSVKKLPGTVYELSMSNWAPTAMSEPTSLTNTSDFKVVGMPEFSLNVSKTAYASDVFQLSPKIGLSFLGMQRTGQLGIGSSAYTVSQNLNIYKVRLGGEVATSHFWLGMRPVLALAAIPTWSQSSLSAFNEGVSQVDVSGEASLALEINISPLAEWVGLGETALEVGIETTKCFTGANLTQTAGFAGTRIGLK